MALEVTIESHVDEVLAALPEQIEQALIAIGIAAESNAVEEVDAAVYNTPPSPNYVRTGRLRGSLTHEVDMGDKAAIIGTNVEYAKWVELGTSKMTPRPFLKPAIENHIDEYKALAEQALRG